MRTEVLNKWSIAVVGVVAFAVLLWWRLSASLPAEQQTPASAKPGRVEHTSEPLSSLMSKESELPQDAKTAEKSSNGPLQITGRASIQALIFSMYMQLEEPLRAWAATRGLPRTDANGNFILDQPYQQYDNETLAALAENGDMWAQQILADRIEHERPADAMELYRQAAAQGSVFAMLKIAELSGRIALISPDFNFENESGGSAALDQYYSLRDSPVPPGVVAYAWEAVAEMAGLPGFMNFTATELPEDVMPAACDLASSIYSDLLARRASLGLGGYPADTPPAWFDANSMGRTSSCEHAQAVQYDFSSCNEIQMKLPEDEQEVVVYICEDV